MQAAPSGEGLRRTTSCAHNVADGGDTPATTDGAASGREQGAATAALQSLRQQHAVALDPQEDLPDVLAAEAAAGILRTRTPALLSEGEAAAPVGLESQSSGIPKLRRTASLAAGSVHTAIDIPSIATLAADFASTDSGSVHSGAKCSPGRPASQTGHWSCFGDVRPSAGIALCMLCFLATACIFNAFIPRSAHQALSAHATQALRYVLPHNRTWEPKEHMIIIMKPGSTMLDDLHAICGKEHPGSSQPVKKHSASRTCDLSLACKHVFGSTIRGIAGTFTKGELELLDHCMPGAVHFMEADARVSHSAATGEPAAEPPNAKAAGGKFSSIAQIRANVRAAGASDGTGIDGITGRPGLRSQGLADHQWNLDRVCKRNLPLNNQYMYGSMTQMGNGNGTTVYIVDSGLQSSLPEFGSRASQGWNSIDSNAQATDCAGHGTALASISTGTVFGVAKAANVVGVKTLDCEGHGSVMDTVAALDWVAGHAQLPAVVVLSLGLTEDASSRALDQAVQTLIDEQGITVVVAAGNGHIDACNVAPADVAAAITVAATNLSTKFDPAATRSTDHEALYRWSNFGACIDISAPGVDIPSACSNLQPCFTSNNVSYSVASGTSFAAPHVAGVAAIYLGEYPNASPAQVKALILGAATRGKLAHSAFPLHGTPDLVLYSLGVLDGGSAAVADSSAADSSVADSDAKDG